MAADRHGHMPETLVRRLPRLPERLLIGLSGGADSVALTELLLCLRAQGRVRLWAVHVNHGLRGAQSDEDERFVRKLCERENLPLAVYRAHPPERPGEDWARQARYGFFRQELRRCGAQAVALAHHRDDQAETLLLHLLRGAGLTGLAGMSPEGESLGVKVVRPLLEFSRQELREALTDAGIPWREDESNGDPRFLRNAVRCELLPLMERLAPGAGARLAGTAELLREDERVLAMQAEALVGREAERLWMPLCRLTGLESGLRSRVLRLWWQCQAGQGREERALSREQTAALAGLITAPAGTRCNLPGGWHGQRGWTHLHLLPPDGRHERPEISLIAASCSPGPGDGRLTQTIPAQLLSECTVRTRRPGDWIRPFSGGGRQTLQDYFVNRRVDAPFRDSVPLLCRGSEVLLAAGVGAGNVPPMNHTKDQLLLRWRGEMPWAQIDEGENRMERDAKLYGDLSRVLVTREEIQQAVKELGRRITEDYAGKEPMMIGILKGAVVFYSDLIREIDLPLRTDFMAVSSYGSATKSTGVVKVLKDLDRDIVGQDVLIVEDIVDSGMTLSYLKKMLGDRGAASIRIVTLLDKPARRRVDLKADYYCFQIPDEFVVGYGLDYDEKYRNLPDIGVLHPRIYGGEG